MTEAVDLDAYVARIGYAGPRTPTVDTLNDVLSAHVQSVPFENLDVLLGRRISLEPAAIQRKIIEERRGGYCFEQNGLLLLVLTQLGFAVTPLSARVRYQRPRDYTPPRTHLFVRVELEGCSWLVDVGVGGLSLTSALRLEPDVEQQTLHEPRRLLREDGRWFHQARLGDEWQDVCEFTLEEMPPIDREVANWFTSAHPDSHFKHRLVVARALSDGGRASILNRELTVRRRDGAAQKQVLQTPAALLAALEEHFGLRFEPGTRFECAALEWP